MTGDRPNFSTPSSSSSSIPSRSRASIVRARLRGHWPVIERGLAELYPGSASTLAAGLLDRIGEHVDGRSDRLWQRDLERDAELDWYQHPAMIGYVAYVDRFAGDLRGVHEHLDYLHELGVTFLHLMPLLRAREGDNDGGYAVQSYDEVDPRLGTIEQLGDLAGALHARGMNLCIDLVLNHTAAEHEWARLARDGDERHRRFYFLFPDREMPDRYERTLREVFPTFAPGNFTWVPDPARPSTGQWVWTTFNEFQWDLDWSNPDVFAAMVDVMLRLSDLGVDVLRLDAVPFMWKREGTPCENLPEVHTLLCTLRAVMAIASPATIFKAEAIVSPHELTRYLGAGDPPRRECELAYHNQLMVLLWSSLATGDAWLMSTALRQVAPIPQHTTWVTYVRCHDDIGWAITDEAAVEMGWSGPDHRRFLSDFYSGAFPTSFARGQRFQVNDGTGDSRISGTAASLSGIDLALAADDPVHLDLACRRLELVYAVAAAFGGIPLVYMGDELGLRNDLSYLDDPTRCDDNRWMHRPSMDWEVAARRTVPGTLEHRIFETFRSLLADRASTPALHGSAVARIVDVDDPALFAFVRRHPLRGDMAMIANFGRATHVIGIDALGLVHPSVVRASGASVTEVEAVIAPFGYAWLASA